MKLTNQAGREIGELTASADMSTALAGLGAASSGGGHGGGMNQVGRGMGAAALDLEISDPWVSVFLPRNTAFARTIAGWLTGSTQGSTTAFATVRNTGRERWGYPGQVRVRFSGGKPGELYALEGAVGHWVDLPPGLRPGESSQVSMLIPRALVPGFYYTATANIDSDRDESAVNNRATYVFFVEDDGQVTRAEGGDSQAVIDQQIHLLQQQRAASQDKQAQAKMSQQIKLLQQQRNSGHRMNAAGTTR